MEEKVETFIYGEIITEPVIKWKNLDGDKLLTGWECRVQTNSDLVSGEEKVLDIQIVYDLKKWEPVHINSFVKLSVQNEQISKTSKSGRVLKCNIVIRK